MAIRRLFGGTHTSRTRRACRPVSDVPNLPIRRHTECRFRGPARFGVRSFPFVGGEFRIPGNRRSPFQRGVPSRGVLNGDTPALIGVREIPFRRRGVFPRFRKILRLSLGGGFSLIFRLRRFRDVFLSSDAVLRWARRLSEKAFRRRGEMADAVPLRRMRFRSPRFPLPRDDRPFQRRARRVFRTPFLFVAFGDGRRNPSFHRGNRNFMGSVRH